MAYRSDLDAALARLEALGPRHPCPTCLERSKRHRRFAMFVLGVFLYLAAFVLMVFASIAGLVTIVLLLVGTALLFARGSDSAIAFGAAAMFAVLTVAGFAAFAWLDRLLAFDVGRFG